MKIEIDDRKWKRRKFGSSIESRIEFLVDRSEVVGNTYEILRELIGKQSTTIQPYIRVDWCIYLYVLDNPVPLRVST
jgi:hypothetical protein